MSTSWQLGAQTDPMMTDPRDNLVVAMQARIAELEGLNAILQNRAVVAEARHEETKATNLRLWNLVDRLGLGIGSLTSPATTNQAQNPRPSQREFPDHSIDAEQLQQSPASLASLAQSRMLPMEFQAGAGGHQAGSVGSVGHQIPNMPPLPATSTTGPSLVNQGQSQARPPRRPPVSPLLAMTERLQASDQARVTGYDQVIAAAGLAPEVPVSGFAAGSGFAPGFAPGPGPGPVPGPVPVPVSTQKEPA